MKTIPKLNELIVYRKRREPALGIFVSQGGLNLTLLTEEGKHLPLELKKMVYRTGISVSPKLSDYEKKMKLRNYRKMLEGEKHNLDLKQLWENLNESGEVEFDEIMDIYRAIEDRTDEEMLKLFWAVDKNRVYFDRAGGSRYLVNGKQAVCEKIEAEKRRKNKEEKRSKALEWIESVKTENGPSSVNEEHIDFIELMASYSFDLDNYERAGDAKRFIQDAGFRDIESIVEFLIKIGYWKEDEDHVSKKFDDFMRFSERSKEETESIISTEPDFSGYTDRTDLDIYSVDDVSTADIDDAISFEVVENEYIIGVHIADVSFFVKRENFLDTEAKNRGESVYFVEKTINMFPDELANSKFGLTRGEKKPALSLFAVFDRNDHSLKTYRFEKTIVKVKDNITYEKAIGLFESDFWSPVVSLTENLRQKRLEKGALIVQLPELKIEIDDSNRVVTRKNLMTSKSHRVISECMVLMNSLAASFFSKNNIPAIFRSQTQEIEKEAFDLDEQDPLYPTKIVKFLKPSRVVLAPEPHRSLGIDSYVQITSPIRRYLDIVLQRQLASFLTEGKITYTGEEMENLNSMVSMNVREIKNAQKSRHRYWFLKYLLQENIRKMEGYVANISRHRTTAYIPEYFTELPFSGGNKKEIKAGEYVELGIKSIDPLRRKLQLKLI